MAEPRDFISIGKEADAATAPDVKAYLAHQAWQDAQRLNGRVFFPPPISATGIIERIRDRMWWKPTVIRDGEPYEVFKRRADAQRAAATTPTVNDDA